MPWVDLRTASGHVYKDWAELMPRIPNFVTNSIIYLYEHSSAAKAGDEDGGSGFIIAMPSEVRAGALHVYAVTNAHVIEGGFPVVRVNLKFPSSGNTRTEILDFSQASWVCHERHDLAVRAFPPETNIDLFQISLLNLDYLMTREEAAKLDVGPGDELCYIGRFVRHAGVRENSPSVRFGNISMSPNEEAPVQYEIAGKTRNQVSFLVEARSRSGYSGSPVFFINQHCIGTPRLVIPQFGELRIIGVDWGHLLEDVTLHDPATLGAGGIRTMQINSGIMGVVPSWYLEDFIKQSPRLIEQRRRDDDYYRNLRFNAKADVEG